MPRPTSFPAQGSRISLRLEPCFLAAVEDIARRETVTPGEIIASAASAHVELNRTAATRTYALNFYRTALEAHETCAVQA